MLESPGGGVGPDSPTSVPRAAELAAARGGGQVCLPGTPDLLKSTPDLLIGTSDLLSNQLQICSTTRVYFQLGPYLPQNKNEEQE